MTAAGGLLTAVGNLLTGSGGEGRRRFICPDFGDLEMIAHQASYSLYAGEHLLTRQARVGINDLVQRVTRSLKSSHPQLAGSWTETVSMHLTAP